MKQIHIFTVFGTPYSFYDGQFRYLTEQGNEIILVSSDDPRAEDFAERNHIRFIPVTMPRSMSPVTIARAIKSITAIIKREKPDAVFGHTPVGALVAMIASKRCGVRNRVYYRHGLIYTTMTGAKRIAFKKEEQFVAALSTTVVNVSHSLSNLAVADKLNKDSKQHVIGHGTCGGIDGLNIFNPELLDAIKLTELKEKSGLKDADIVFGFCGRICVDKGIPEMIDGFMMFREKHPELKSKLLLIGALDIRDGVSEEYKRIISENPDIIHTGSLEKNDIPYYYSMLDVFVFPSHREGFGMCVVEASAMEKPILVSRSHGCVDSIVEHETGEYIELSAEGICDGMEKMMDVDLRKRLGENGRKKVLEWYDFRVMWPQVAELYKKILK